MQASDCPFLKIIQVTKQYIIPVFQRDYDWTEEQCQQLFADILAIAKTDSDRDHGSTHSVISTTKLAIETMAW